MEEPFEGVYFNWLCAKVIDVKKKKPSETYWRLLEQLHRTEFVPLLQMDENRAAYGKELRREFLLAADAPDNLEWRETLGCSILELLIAVARDLEFQTDVSRVSSFWELINNLGLIGYYDAINFDPAYVDGVLEVFNARAYLPDGYGGLFPLKNAQRDQREVEIWYQMFDYLTDQGRML